MKLSEYQRTYYEFSGKASDVARQLAFAGIAIVWLFKVDSANSIGIPENLILASVLIAGSLTCDLLHYVVGSMVWKGYYRHFERKGASQEEDLPDHSLWLERPIAAAFWVKIFLLLCGYILILVFL